MLGVVDESGEEYAYPADIFETVNFHLPLYEYAELLGILFYNKGKRWFLHYPRG